MKISWLVIACIVILCVSVAESKVSKGHLKTKKQWHYFDKFCFSKSQSKARDLNVTWTITTDNTDLYVLFYLGDNKDPSRQGIWEPVYKNRNRWNCTYLSSLHREKEIYKVVSGTQQQARLHQSSRQYFWFLAVADCSSSSGINIKHYDIEFINPGGHWARQFSFDQQTVGQFLIFFFFMYICLISAHGYSCYQLFRIDCYHPIVKLLSVIIALEFFSIFLEMVHYSIYANNGIGAPFFRGIGDLLTICSQLSLMFLCMLIAHGWAITSNQLEKKNILVLAMSLMLIFYIILFIWDNASRDSASTLYFYESAPGILVLLLRIAIAFWFIWTLRNTLRMEASPPRRRFYRFFGIAYSAWFFILPLTVFGCSFIEPWFRFKVTKDLTLFVDFFGYLALAYLLWFTRAQEYFTIKPKQLLVDEEDNDVYGSAGPL
eukprot:TRINITY_DN10530_c0_g1_i1.p1 TRINITY_DN10530_c0_g1~~TRINITY_DN10530_c0_g1_i1.p1  ORF type:complete len:432 (-),score=43.99 TRINITY_DN10530_c0_g1_i1:65-1360(-)